MRIYEESWFCVSLFIGLCTQELFRNVLTVWVSGFIGAVLILCYGMVLILPRVMVVVVTTYLAQRVFRVTALV